MERAAKTVKGSFKMDINNYLLLITALLSWLYLFANIILKYIRLCAELFSDENFLALILILLLIGILGAVCYFITSALYASFINLKTTLALAASFTSG